MIRCLPRWSVMSGFMFSSTVETAFSLSMSELEYTGLTPTDVTNRQYMANQIAGVTSVEYCAR